MAASIQSHARIRLNFVNLPIESAWMLIDYKKLPLISDIVCEINKRHFGGSHELTLSLQGSCLPLQEKSLLLRDEDVVTVRAEGQDELSTSSRSTSKVSDTPVDTSKKRKRKHEESDESCEEYSNRKEHYEHRHHEHKRSKKHKKEKRREEEKKREEERKREKEKKEKIREKERLKEITDIVSTQTVSKSDLSRNECSGDSTERASKRMKVDVSQTTEKSHEDTTVVYQGPSTSNSEPVTMRESKIIIDHQNKNDNAEVKKQKKKRIRKYRKRKNKSPSLEGFDAVGMTPVQESSNRVDTSPAFQKAANETVKTKETQWDKQVNTYQGSPVDTNKTYFGSIPDKLLQPKYYRHQYRNLRQYNVEPNKHIKYPSDPETEDKEEQQHYDQYNFLCSTRYSEFQESNSQESEINASPDVVSENINNSNVVYQSSSTPNNSKHTEDKTGNTSVRSDMNGDLSYEHETETFSNKKKSKDMYANQNKSNSYNTVSHNGYSRYSGEENTSPVSRAAPTSLVQSKLPNGVTVFSRQRRSFPKAEAFSKEEQLNTVATNRSFIYQNPVESEIVENGNFVVDPEEVLEAEKIKKDYASFPALAGPPRIGDKIAYRILEMSSEYTPEVSDYKEAEVMSFDHATQQVQLKNLFKSDSNRDPWEDKFHISIDDGDTLLTSEQPDSDEAMLPWNSLLEPRLVS